MGSTFVHTFLRMNKNLVLFCWCLLPLAVLAQTNMDLVIESSRPPAIPTEINGYWNFAIAALTPIVVWGIRKLMGFIGATVPRELLAAISPFVGLGLGLLFDKVGKMNLPWWQPALAGGFGVMIREVINQNVTERLKAPEVKIAEHNQEIAKLEIKAAEKQDAPPTTPPPSA